MKNVVLLVLDSFTIEALKDKRVEKTAMPFFSKLREKSIYAENYYSQGPHTEMGMQALVTGMNTLDNSASLRRYVYADKTIFDYFKDAGYKLSQFSWPSNYYPKRLYGYIDDFFLQGDSFIEVIYWRLMYYVELYHKGEMLEQDYVDIIGCFTDSFNSYLNVLNVNAHKPEAYIFIKKRTCKVDFEKRYNEVMDEYQRFLEDKRKYVEDILAKNGKLPDVLIVDDNDPSAEEDYIRNKIEPLVKENASFFRLLQYRQVKDALFDKRISKRRITKSFINYIKKNEHEYLGALSNRVKQYKTLNPLNMDRHHIDSSSLKTELEILVDYLEKNKQKNQDCFVYIHPLSQHYPTQWLSFDRDIEELRDEINAAKKLIKSIKSYKGNYSYLLGLRYMDECLKKFFGKLKETGNLQNTVIVITADHGSSVAMNPIREEPSFNNCHTELFHVPLLIYEHNGKPQRLTGFFTHRDLLPTLLEIAKVDATFTGRGRSILDSDYKPTIALSERTPSGTPALLHRDVIYTIRDRDYLVEYRCNPFKSFEDGILTDVYDLNLDPEELNNLRDDISMEKIKYLLEVARLRHIQLSENYSEWLKMNHSNQE